MTWNAFHHRGDVLRDVVAEAEARRDGVLPMELPGVTETFGDAHHLVAALQLRWHTRLAGSIERALLDQPDDPESAVVVRLARRRRRARRGPPDPRRAARRAGQPGDRRDARAGAPQGRRDARGAGRPGERRRRGRRTHRGAARGAGPGDGAPSGLTGTWHDVVRGYRIAHRSTEHLLLDHRPSRAARRRLGDQHADELRRGGRRHRHRPRRHRLRVTTSCASTSPARPRTPPTPTGSSTPCAASRASWCTRSPTGPS